MDRVVTDEYFMREALVEAQKAFERGEIPVGAVIVLDNQIIARAHNLKETLNDATAHAEILAIKEASKVLKNWRLLNTTLYVTKEPCIMCSGAIVQARIKRLVYSVDDPKGGAVMSLYRLLSDRRLNHQVEIVKGILEPECREILKRFFLTLRHSQ